MMTSTGDVFLSVSAQAPEQSKPHRMSMMSPLLEEEDERESMLTEREELVPPEFEIDDQQKQAFMTDTKETNLPSNQNDDTSGYDIVDGVLEPEFCDRLNSDGELFDEVFSDSCSDGDANEVDYETDLEFDEEKWLYPERFDLDLTGKVKYLKVCEDMGISPTSYFVKHIQDRELKMKFHGLGPTRMRALSVPLQTNTNIEILNLEGNAIDEDGAICLTKVLKENFFITELVLAENKLGTEGGKAISEMLVNNRNLYKVDLTGNEIGDGAAPMFCEVLYNNKLLKILLLGNNNFEDEGARMFKPAISDNTTLEELDLSWNNFKSRGSVLLAEALQENVGLKIFNLAMAGLGQEGAEAMGKALKENRTLLELDISLNRINLEGAQALSKGIKENDTLKILKLASNPFDSEGAMAILEGVDMNDSCELQLLDLSNVMVKTEFAKVQERLESERQMKIIQEGVIPEFARTYSARLSAFRLDPVGTFKKSAHAASIDLEVLLSPVMDEEFTIEIKQFKNLVKRTPIMMSDDQINIVALRLANEGRVQCRPLFEEAEDKNEEDDGDDNKQFSSPRTDRSDRSGRLGVSKQTTIGRNAIK